MRNNPLKGWQAGAGVNMALRRTILTSVGPFDEGLDVGSPVPGGGDTDMFRRILAAGYRIIYDPEALNWHRHRSEWKELRRQLFGYEMAGFAVWMRSLLSDREFEVLKIVWNWFWHELANLVRSLLNRPGCTPLDLIVARFIGAACGPWIYLYSRCYIRLNRDRKK
jgi:GT2 family glycosyltransferase